MSTSRSIVLCLSLAAISFPAYSDSKVRLGGGLGNTDISLKKQLVFDDEKVGKNSKAFNIYGGYAFENNVFVDLALESAENDILFFKNAFDNLSYVSLDLSIGYIFNFYDFYFEPAVGYSDWSVESQEGAFLNSGPEEKKEIDGHDFFGKLTLGYRFSSSVGLSFTYKTMNADFGKYESTYASIDLSL